MKWGRVDRASQRQGEEGIGAKEDGLASPPILTPHANIMQSAACAGPLRLVECCGICAPRSTRSRSMPAGLQVGAISATMGDESVPCHDDQSGGIGQWRKIKRKRQGGARLLWNTCSGDISCQYMVPCYASPWAYWRGNEVVGRYKNSTIFRPSTGCPLKLPFAILVSLIHGTGLSCHRY